MRLAERPIRSKLALLLTVPLVAILTLAALIGVTGMFAALKAEQARRLVNVGVIAGELTAQLQRERAAAAAVFVQSSQPGVIETYRRQAEVTDVAAAQFVAAQKDLDAPAGLAAPLQRLDAQLTALPLLREQVRSGQDATGSLTIFRYRALTAELGGYRTALSQLGVDAETANGLRASATVSQAIEALGLMQVAVLPAIRDTPLTAAEQQQIVSANATFNEALETFRQIAPADWQATLAGQASSKTALAGERLQGVAARAQANAPLDLGSSASNWVTATNARMQQLHAAEHQFDTDLLASVTGQRDQQRNNLLWLGIGVVTVLVVLGTVVWRVSASITGPLRLLQAGAQRMATVRLPEMVRRITTGPATWELGPGESLHTAADADTAAGQLAAIGGGEVGDVAAAFEQVARTAVELAGQEATARATVDDVVQNVARRLLSHIEMLTSQLDELERPEADVQRLEQLYGLDHRTTLARRTIGNLLVIAGGRAGEDVHEPTALFDVVRGAFSRIDQYTRVENNVGAHIMIEAFAVADLLHLLTELFANGTRFSPPHTLVYVQAEVVGDTLHIQVTDEGYGIDSEELEEQRQRLRHFRLDAQTVRHMGLPVVGRIAERLGITVNLRSSKGEGTRVDLNLPATLFQVAEPQPAAPTALPRQPTSAQTSARGAVPDQPYGQADTAPFSALTSAAPAVAVMVPTQELLPYAGRPPASVAPHHEGASAPTVIFDQLASANPWFAGAGGADQPPPSLGEQWQQGASVMAAHAAGAAGPDTAPPAEQVTRSGLPKRQPRQYEVPRTSVQPVPRQRDPQRSRAQLSAAAIAMRRPARSPSGQLGPS
ncbi:nitrate- and nitrite sensing domain-containing protein [Actinoplanes sp. NPDC048988]|uniref:sensor histidine kinase n=1 Tax=Actinoplanes sp. NPDC048988 TaxID=3363901 RepID=UPI0037232E5E